MQRVRAMASSYWQTVGTRSFGLDASTRPTFSPGVTTAANCHHLFHSVRTNGRG